MAALLLKTNGATGYNGIDFGTVKVADKPLKTMKVENSGKYEVHFKFSLNNNL